MDKQIVVYSYDGILLRNKRNKLLINTISISWSNLTSSIVNKGYNKNQKLFKNERNYLYAIKTFSKQIKKSIFIFFINYLKPNEFWIYMKLQRAKNIQKYILRKEDRKAFSFIITYCKPIVIRRMVLANVDQ